LSSNLLAAWVLQMNFGLICFVQRSLSLRMA